MPRNSSGTYSLPAGNPVVSNTLIQSTWANTTLSDVSTAMTDSLDRNGRGAMLAALKNIDGTAVAPSITFSSEGTLGIYRPSAGVLGFAAGGALVLSIAAAGLTFTNPIILPIGSATAPSLTFVANTNTGVYSPTTNQVGVTTNGAQRLLIDATGNLTVATGILTFTTGQRVTFAAPGSNLVTALDAAGTLGFQTGGTNTRLFVDASGHVLVGSVATANNLRVAQLLGTVAVGAVGGAAFTTYNATATGTTVDIQHSAGTAEGSFTALSSGWGLGTIAFRGSNGAAFGDGALVSAITDAAWTGVSQPTALTFSTTAASATSATERLRIDSLGNVGIGRAATSTLDVFAASGNPTLTIGGAGTFSSILSMGAGGGGSSQVKAAAALLFFTAAAQVGEFDASGQFAVGSAAPTAKLSILSSTSNAATTSAWSAAFSNFGPNANSTTGAAFAIGYNTGADQAELLSLAPGIAWKPMKLFGNSFGFVVGGSTSVMVITSAGVIQDGAGNELGYKGIPNNGGTGGAYTVVQADNGKKVVQGFAANVTVNTGYSNDFTTVVVNASGSTITIVQGTSVTLRLSGTASTGNRTLVAWGVATLSHIGSNIIMASGAGVS